MRTKRTIGRLAGVSALALAVFLSPGFSPRAEASTGALLAQAEAAIAAKDYFRATRILTALAQTRSPDSQRAQELLGTTREANGQLAQALAEYDTYLRLYPNGDGASRVKARRAALVGAGDVSDSGIHGTVTLAYRLNDGGERPDASGFGVIFDEQFTALTLGLQFTATSESDTGRSRLVFSGAGDLASSGIPSREPKVSELFFDYTWKSNGAIATIGRFKPRPGGVGYRVDGFAYSLPVSEGVTVGFDAGKVVTSSRSDFFGDDRHLLAASVTLDDTIVPGELSLYVAGQWDGSTTDRTAVGAEYQREFENGSSAFASAEYDFKFSRVNRLQVNGNFTLGNGDRLSANAAFFRSPSLSLENALFGQVGVTLDDLRLVFTEQQIEQFARDQSSQVSTASLVYSTRLDPRWSLILDGSVISFEGPVDNATTSGNLTDLGTRTYVGGTLTGSSVFSDGDSVNLALRYSKGDDDRTIALDSSVMFPVTDAFSLRPRLRLAKRMNDGGVPDDDIVMGSIDARYRFDRNTSLIVNLGAKNEDQDEFFFAAGITKSF